MTVIPSRPRKFDLDALLSELQRHKMTRPEIMQFCGIQERPADGWIARLYAIGLKSAYTGERFPHHRRTVYWLDGAE